MSPLNSAYRPHHSTETALIKVHNDITQAMDQHQLTLLVMLDNSAAFDTVQHDTLFTTLLERFNICGQPLAWLQSYLSQRTQRVLIEDVSSAPKPLSCGVPQGSCLGPVLFSMYVTSLYDVISKHLPNVHGYADDNQLYISFGKGDVNQQEALQAMEACIIEVRSWMVTNSLMINDTKTEVMIIGTKFDLNALQVDGITVGDAKIAPVKELRNLGVIWDNQLLMKRHIAKVCTTAHYQLYRLRMVRSHFSDESMHTLVHAFITSHLDYCNSLLYGVAQVDIEKLQRVQNCAARLITRTPRFDHITPVLIKLHWLKVNARIIYKIALITYKALHDIAPAYISDLIIKYIPPRDLRSSGDNLLVTPITHSKAGDRSFHHSAHVIWNTLPHTLRNATSLNIFKTGLKTHLFKLEYNL